MGSHLGVYAKPLPGFINDVNILPLDITATVNWTTISNSSSQVEYGTTTNLGTFSVLDPTPVLNHSVNLTGLVAGARYYYRALSVFNGTPFSATGAFTATNYNVTTTRPVFGITKSWKWNTNNLDGINWKATNYNDSSWSSGPGLLYVETSFSVSPKNTPLPPNNGLPVTGVPVFPTYYFRTTFNYTNSPSATTLTFSNYVDDGYVYYLNGVEIQRTRMPATPTVITNKTVATANPCAGDANCPDFYTTSGNLITNLVMGTNVLAVEVHQSSNGNIDMAFGSALFANFTTYLLPTLNVARAGNVTTLSWNSPGYVLQQSSQISSPKTLGPTSPARSTPARSALPTPPKRNFTGCETDCARLLSPLHFVVVRRNVPSLTSSRRLSPRPSSPSAPRKGPARGPASARRRQTSVWPAPARAAAAGRRLSAAFSVRAVFRAGLLVLRQRGDEDVPRLRERLVVQRREDQRDERRSDFHRHPRQRDCFAARPMMACVFGAVTRMRCRP